MAGTTKSAFFCIALVVVIFMTTNLPKTTALLLNGQNVNALDIVGVARCTSTVTGTCITCAPLSNLRLAVRLNDIQIATVNTGSDGSFRININVNNIASALTDIAALRVVAPLPIAGCPLFATATGILQGTPVLQTPTSIVNGVATLIVPVFNIVP